MHLEQDFPGSGIGLAMARRIVERHGGRIWARGRVGRGAAIYFQIPEPDENAAERMGET